EEGDRQVVAHLDHSDVFERVGALDARRVVTAVRHGDQDLGRALHNVVVGGQVARASGGLDDETASLAGPGGGGDDDQGDRGAEDLRGADGVEGPLTVRPGCHRLTRSLVWTGLLARGRAAAGLGGGRRAVAAWRIRGAG